MNGTLDLWRFFNLTDSTSMRGKWHPLAEEEIIVLGGCVNNSTLGYVRFFNLSGNKFSFYVDTPCIYSFDFIPKESILLASAAAELLAFNMTNQEVSLIGSILNKGFD